MWEDVSNYGQCVAAEAVGSLKCAHEAWHLNGAGVLFTVTQDPLELLMKNPGSNSHQYTSTFILMLLRCAGIQLSWRRHQSDSCLNIPIQHSFIQVSACYKWAISHKLSHTYVPGCTDPTNDCTLVPVRGCKYKNRFSLRSAVYYREGERSTDCTSFSLSVRYGPSINFTAALWQTAASLQQLCTESDLQSGIASRCFWMAITFLSWGQPPGLVVSVSPVTLNRQEETSDAVDPDGFFHPPLPPTTPPAVTQAACPSPPM